MKGALAFHSAGKAGLIWFVSDSKHVPTWIHQWCLSNVRDEEDSIAASQPVETWGLIDSGWA